MLPKFIIYLLQKLFNHCKNLYNYFKFYISLHWILVYIIVFNFNFIFSQIPKKQKIKIIQSKIIEKNPLILEGNIFLAGNVELEHDKARIYADTILINKYTVQARSQVRVLMKDGISLTCAKVEYNENTKKITARGNVVLTDQDKIIRNEELFYDIDKDQAYFNNGGIITIANKKIETKELIYDKNKDQIYFNNWATIRDLITDDVITSKSGIFFIAEQRYTFNTSLKMTSKDYIIDSQKMTIDNILKRVDFLGSTTIRDTKNPSNYIYTEKGYRYIDRKENFFKKNSRIHYDGKIFKGNNIYYNEISGYGKALGNVSLEDPIKRQILKGGKAEIFRFNDSVIITQKPYGIRALKNDSIFWSADTLICSQYYKPIQNQVNIIWAFRNVRIFKSDFQGICDSIKIDQYKGIVEFYHNPIFWSSNHQITSDTVVAYINSKTKELDSIELFKNAFAISKSNSLLKKEFNQTKGRKITVHLEEKKIHQILVEGNAQSIIYIDEKSKNTKTNKRIGINRSDCGIILIDIKNQKIKNISCKMKGESKLYPETKLSQNERYLENFIWREKERLQTWRDIFIVEHGS